MTKEEKRRTAQYQRALGMSIAADKILTEIRFTVPDEDAKVRCDALLSDFSILGAQLVKRAGI